MFRSMASLSVNPSRRIEVQNKIPILCVWASTWSITWTVFWWIESYKLQDGPILGMKKNLVPWFSVPCDSLCFSRKQKGPEKPKKISSSTQFVCYFQYSSLTLLSRTVYNQKKKEKKKEKRRKMRSISPSQQHWK